MSKFISISTFSSLFSSHADLLSAEGLEKFKTELNAVKGQEICRTHGIERWELEHFVSTLNISEHVVFYGWIAQNSTLESVLMRKGELTPFEDSARHLKHKLSEQYKRFVSPYLSKALLRHSGEDKKTLSVAMTYTRLLDTDHCAVIEEQLLKSIHDEIKQAKDQMKQVLEEQELVELIQPLCSDEVIACMNQLSRSMYAAKLNYVDDMLAAIRTKSCTARFANWILKRMELVQLNKEHAYKINDLRQELRDGTLKVRNSGVKGRAPIRWKTMITTTVILLFALFIVYIVVYQPFSDVQGTELSDNTSFQQFTIEERKKIDSLLKDMNGNAHEDEMWIDQGIPIIGGSSVISIRTEFDNQNMEEIYQDLNKDAELQEQGYTDTCLRAVQYKRLPGVKNLADKKGSIEAMVRNDSDYDVVLFVADSYTNGEVYSMQIKSGDIQVFEISKDYTLLMVVGNTYQTYSPPNVAVDELPSSNYTHHFCDTDHNHKESINTPYKLTRQTLGKTKFLITGKLGGYVNLLDIYGVLEPM